MQAAPQSTKLGWTLLSHNRIPLNPGRSGLTRLGANTLLEWRLWAITGAAKARDIQVLFLPGARLPPGTILPQIFGFCFLGPRSTQWDTVGLLCAVEMEPLLVPLDDFSTDRVFWLQCFFGPGREGRSFLLCGFYAAPGGELDTWSWIIKTFHEVRKKFPGCSIVLAGDASVHLRSVVQHNLSCTCVHCKQSKADAQIEAVILNAGLKVLDFDCPTHCSGTVIGLILVPREAGASAENSGPSIGGKLFRRCSWRTYKLSNWEGGW